MADKTPEKGSIEDFLAKLDPKTIGNIMSQIKPEHVNAALGLLGNMDPKALNNMVSGVQANKDKPKS